MVARRIDTRRLHTGDELCLGFRSHFARCRLSGRITRLGVALGRKAGEKLEIRPTLSRGSLGFDRRFRFIFTGLERNVASTDGRNAWADFQLFVDKLRNPMSRLCAKDFRRTSRRANVLARERIVDSLRHLRTREVATGFELEAGRHPTLLRSWRRCDCLRTLERRLASLESRAGLSVQQFDPAQHRALGAPFIGRTNHANFLDRHDLDHRWRSVWTSGLAENLWPTMVA